jgi:hypothetical protein
MPRSNPVFGDEEVVLERGSLPPQGERLSTVRLMQISMAMLLAVQAVSRAAADGLVPMKDTPLGIDLMMTDGGLLGIAKIGEAVTPKPSGPPSPEFFPVDYVWDGAHLRVRPPKNRQWIPNDGWYVTADYSTDPPRVILTKDPRKDSRWRFIATSEPRSIGYYIKIENDRGQDAWLDLVDTGKRYSLRQASAGYRDVRVFKPILSFGNKRAFGVVEVAFDGGK